MKSLKNIILLILTALIWGVAFVAQSSGGDAVGPYAFNCLRSMIGFLVLIPVIRFLDSKGLTKGKPVTKEEKKILVMGGICCGICLGSASIFQQLGIYNGTAAGKAGFLTACYIILVPILSLFLKKKCGINVWIAVLITIIGLYLLCMTGTSFALQSSDILVLICSLLYSCHILVIDHFAEKCDPVRMSQLQFLTAAVISFVPMVWSDWGHSAAGFNAWLPNLMTSQAWISILYAGALSSGVAYTLQIIGQIGFNPTIASLIMSLESVFSVLAGWLILGEMLSARELCGCLLIFAAIVLAQIPLPGRKRGKADL